VADALVQGIKDFIKILLEVVMAKVRLLYKIEDGKRGGIWEDAFFEYDEAINEDICHTKEAFLKAAAVFEQSIKEAEEKYRADKS
jgi:hypothetical protein